MDYVLKALPAYIRLTYFQKKSWALDFDDDKTRVKEALEREEPFRTKVENAIKRLAEKDDEARLAAAPYLRPVGGPKKKSKTNITLGTSHGGP